MHSRQILTLLLGMLLGGAAGASAVYLFVRPNDSSEKPAPPETSAKPGLPQLKIGPRTPELEEGLRVLDRFAGTWEAEITPLTSEGTPVGKARRTEITAEWAVNGRFLLSRSRDEDGAEGLALRTYDLEKKEYPYWNFNWRGRLYQARGRWNEKTSTMTTERTTPEGHTEVTTFSPSPDPNTFQFDYKSMNEQGKLIAQSQGKLTRRTK